MKFLITIYVDGESINAWCETEIQARALALVIAGHEAPERLTIHKLDGRGGMHLLSDLLGSRDETKTPNA